MLFFCKINQVFISHADRDHLTGLLQFNQLNARPGFPVIHYPRDSGSFSSLAKFSRQFDQQVAQTITRQIDCPARNFGNWQNAMAATVYR